MAFLASGFALTRALGLVHHKSWAVGELEGAADYVGCYENEQAGDVLAAGDVADVFKAWDVADAGEAAKGAGLLAGQVAEQDGCFSGFQGEYARDLAAVEDGDVVEAGAAECIDFEFEREGDIV